MPLASLLGQLLVRVRRPDPRTTKIFFKMFLCSPTGSAPLSCGVTRGLLLGFADSWLGFALLSFTLGFNFKSNQSLIRPQIYYTAMEWDTMPN